MHLSKKFRDSEGNLIESKNKISNKDDWRKDVSECFKYFINPARQGIGLSKKPSPIGYLKEEV